MNNKFVLTQKTFDYIKDKIYELSGIYLTDSKRDMVFARLSRAANKAKCKTIDDFMATVDLSSPAKKQHFINILTTNKTAFYRESYHFNILEHYLEHKVPDGNPNIWCSAASTGEEPYTISMACHDVYGPNHKATIICTDIDTDCLLKASQGIYTQYDVDNIMTHDIAGNFEPTNLHGKVKIKPEFKKGVSFKRHNLMTEFKAKEKFDVIFCRNVMIYFNQETQRLILEDFKRNLKPGGILFAGHSENFTYFASDIFRPIGKTTYCHAENMDDPEDVIGKL
jgi:chemotaxis protein methyltransferase CheR